MYETRTLLSSAGLLCWLFLSSAVVAQPPSPEAAALQASLNAAVAAHAPTFEIASGVYTFNGAPLSIVGASDIVISGASGAAADVVLLFAPGAGVSLSNCTRVTFAYASIDYYPLPYAHAQVVALGASSLVVQLYNDSLTIAELYARYPPHDIHPPGSVFGSPSRGGSLIGSVCGWSPVPATLLPNGSYSIACHPGATEVGDTFVVATRIGFTLTLSNTSAMIIRSINIRSASYMAVTEFQGEGGNLYEDVSLLSVNSTGGPAPLASNADGFHSSGMRYGPTLRRVTMRNLLDDYFNVHSTFQVLVGSGGGERSLLIGDYQLFPGGNTLYGTQRTLDRVGAGDSISLYPLNSFIYPPSATGIVSSIELLPNADALLASAYANASAAAKTTPCSACHAGLNAFASAQLYNVTFEAPMGPSANPPLLVNVDTLANTNAIIEDSSFSGSGSNLGRFKSSGGAIRNCTWDNTISQNLEIETLQNWLEGAVGVHDINVTNNTFFGTRGENPIHTFGSANVTQADNLFLS